MNKKKTKTEQIEDNNRKSIEMYCPYCGHTNTIPVYVDNKICHWCNHKIRNTTKAYFEKKLKEMMKEGK